MGGSPGVGRDVVHTGRLGVQHACPGSGGSYRSRGAFRLGGGEAAVLLIYCSASSRSTCFCTLPVLVFGRSLKTTCFGALKCAIWFLQ